MNIALERLAAERIRHEQTSAFQIKVGPFNFYPGKGTIYMDGDQKARPERGLEAFIALISQVRTRNAHAFEYKPARDSLPKGPHGFSLTDAISND
jgi:hypothetical protein